MICYLNSFKLDLPLNGSIGKNNKSLLGINSYIFNKSWNYKDLLDVSASISLNSPSYLGLSVESGSITVNGELSFEFSNDYLTISALSDKNTVIKWEGKYRGLLEGKSLFGSFKGEIDYIVSSRLGTNLTEREYKNRRKYDYDERRVQTALGV